jgi:hypothetical protein
MRIDTIPAACAGASTTALAVLCDSFDGKTNAPNDAAIHQTA